VRSGDSLNELSKTDDYLAKCLSQFDQVEYCNVDSDNLDPILSSGSFSDLIKAVLSTKSSNVLYKSDNNKALLDKKSLTTNSNSLQFPEIFGTGK
jgi:hypothetical protein